MMANASCKSHILASWKTAPKDGSPLVRPVLGATLEKALCTGGTHSPDQTSFDGDT